MQWFDPNAFEQPEGVRFGRTAIKGLGDGDTLVAEGAPGELLVEIPDPVPESEEDKQRAAEVKALKKPVLAAWAVNRLVRTQRKDIDALVAGRDLLVTSVEPAGPAAAAGLAVPVGGSEPGRRCAKLSCACPTARWNSRTRPICA